MRAFIGIDFSSELKAEIGQLQKELRAHTISGRWKHVDNFHLTLKFLAEIDSDKVEDIDRIMEELSKACQPFMLNIEEMGYFPGRDSLRVVWLGLGGELRALEALQRDLEEKLSLMGIEKERREYRPHVTIGQDLVLDIDFDEVKRVMCLRKFSEIHVDKVSLFKSEQIANKRVYTPIRQYGLNQSCS